MEIDPTGNTSAELWRLWTEWDWVDPPSADEYLSVLENIAAYEDTDDRHFFQPRVARSKLSDAADFLTHALFLNGIRADS